MEHVSHLADAVMYRTYSRRMDLEGTREEWLDIHDRVMQGLLELGKLNEEEFNLISHNLTKKKAMPSGRYLWVGGTEHAKNPVNYPSLYNCTSTVIDTLDCFALLFDLAMQGCGTGALLEKSNIENLPPVVNKVPPIKVIGEFGSKAPIEDTEVTPVFVEGREGILITVGDSRKGWVDAYYYPLWWACTEGIPHIEFFTVDISHVRAAGEWLKGFGGVSNPIALPGLFEEIRKIINSAVGGKLNALQACLLIDVAARVAVAGNIRRSAGIRQFSVEDEEAGKSKQGLWRQDASGSWAIDPDRDALRMANHTRVFHYKPSLEEIQSAVSLQYNTGEGAIQWAGEAIYRASADIIPPGLHHQFIRAYERGEGIEYLRKQGAPENELDHRIYAYGLNPCITGDSWVMTTEGPRQVSELIGSPYPALVGGLTYYSTDEGFWYTGDKEVYELETTHGYKLRLTEDHKVQTATGMVPAKELNSKHKIVLDNPGYHRWSGQGTMEQGWVLGSLIGDGSLTTKSGYLRYWGSNRLEMLAIAESYTGLKGHDNGVIASITRKELCQLANSWGVTKAHKTITPSIERGSFEFYVGLLRGLFDADGTVSTNPKSRGVRLPQSNLGTLEAVQRMLARMGIVSKIYKDRRKAGYRPLPDGEGGLKPFWCKSQHELVVTKENCAKFYQLIGFNEAPKMTRLGQMLSEYTPYSEHYTTGLKSLTFKGVEPVYDCTVPGPHRFSANCITVSNCGEIIGNNYFCNLAEVHLNNLGTSDRVEQRQAFRAGGLAVASLLQHEFVTERYKISREIDPIVGVSFTGYFDFMVNALGVDWLDWLVNRKREKDSSRAKQMNEFEIEHLSFWKRAAEDAVWAYCDKFGLRRPNRCTTVQPAGCLDKTAVRVFDSGLIYADEVVDPGSGETKGLNLAVRGGIPTTTAIANQPLELVKVTLANKRELKMTPDHRLSVEGSWVKASELTPGMRIDFSLGQYTNTVDTPLAPPLVTDDSVGKGRPPLRISTPATLTPELGYVLGCLYGNGCCSPSKSRIRFSHGNLEVLDKISGLFTKLFNLDGSPKDASILKNGTRWELSYGSKALFNWLMDTGLAKTDKSKALDRLPKALRTSSKETLLAFFCGLIDTDGHVRTSGSLSIDSASEQFIRNLQQVGEAIGLSFSVVHNTKGDNLQKVKSMWALCLSRMVSNTEAIDYLNEHSVKCGYRPLQPPKRTFKFEPYSVMEVERVAPDYSYDFAVEGVDDDDSWYWQGGLKSHNTKSLLTGASSGWHPPKAQRWLRRVTFRREDPVALACMDLGYLAVPSQNCTDANGNLLNDPFDPRVYEWLIVFPEKTNWADMPGVDQFDLSNISIESQFDLYMNVQRYYTTHNTSATLEIRQNEIDKLSKLIHEAIENDNGYISAAVLARFDDTETFPRLPFEPISKQQYDEAVSAVHSRRKYSDFYERLAIYDKGVMPTDAQGPAGCDSVKCLIP